MLSQYAFIAVLAIIAFALPVIGLVLAWLLRPKKPNPIKNSTYECGMETIGDTWVQFKAQYYLFALIFVVFDVEAVFLFPWAVAYEKLGAVRPGRDDALRRHPAGRTALRLAQGRAGVAVDA